MESFDLLNIEQTAFNNIEDIERNINTNLSVHPEDTLQRMCSKDVPMSNDAVEYDLEQEQSI